VTKTALSVKIDLDLKNQAQTRAKDLGLSLSAVVAAGLRSFVAARAIKLAEEPKLAADVKAELIELSRQARAGGSQRRQTARTTTPASSTQTATTGIA